MPPPALLLNALRKAPSYNDLRLQWINDLEVIPGPNSVEFRFNTEWPSEPMIQIYDGRPFSLATLVGTTLSQRSRYIHATRVPNQQSFMVRDLQQDSAYWYRILAPTQDPQDRPAIKWGQFFTGTREARVLMERIDVIHSGDRHTTGDWQIAFGIYNRDTGDLLHSWRWPGLGANVYTSVKGLSALIHPFGDAPFVIDQAPDNLRLYIRCSDDDTSDIEFGFDGKAGDGLEAPSEMPETARFSPIDDEDDKADWAEAIEDVQLPDREGRPIIRRKLRSGPVDVVYIATVHIVADIRNSARVPRPPVDRDRVMNDVWNRIGYNVPIGGNKKKMATQFNRAPDGLLYFRERDRTLPTDPPTQWQRIEGEIAGPVRATVIDDERIELVTLDPKGGALRATVSEGSSAAEWAKVGGNIVRSLTSVRTTSGELHLFGLNREGAVEHGVIPRRGQPRWRILRGREFDGPVTSAEVRGGVEVFAANSRGEVFRCRAGSEAEWEPLGKIEALLSLAAQTAEEGRKLVLFAFTTERAVFSKVWDGRKWAPPREKWTALGLLDEIDQPAPKVKQAASRRTKKKTRSTRERKRT